MKDKITEVLNDETFETIEDKFEKLSKELALLVIPKDKYNTLSDRVKNLETEKNKLQEKYDALEKQNMTDEQKKQKELEDIAKEKKELALEKNKYKAKDLFKQANIDDEQIESLLDKVVSEDETKTTELANSFIEILQTKVNETKKQTETNILTGTPKPNIKSSGNEPKEITIEDFKNMNYQDKKQLFNDNPEKYNELISNL